MRVKFLILAKNIKNILPLGLVAQLLLVGCVGKKDGLAHRPTMVALRKSNLNANTSTDSAANEALATPSPTIVRPSGQIFINRDFCSCLEKKPDILNNCAATCSAKDTKAPTLYLTVKPGPEVELNTILVTLQGWCMKEIGDGLTNPICKLEAYDGFSYKNLDVQVSGNSLTADITTLDRDVTYVMTIVESGSGSNARSESFQLRRYDFGTDTNNTTGPLRVVPIHQYTCLNRIKSTLGGGNNVLYAKSVKHHFYYPDNNSPPTIPPGDSNFTCHDISQYGDEDSPLFPRFELQEGMFHLWSETDLRFYDQDSNQKLDINDIVQTRLLKDFSVTSEINIFSELTYPNFPEKQNVTPRMGFIMNPWVDYATNTAYCPTQEHYNSSNSPVFRILKDVVGVDTEGLYMAIKEPEVFSDNQGKPVAAPDDYLFINETLLKKVWFYYKDGLHIQPTSVTASSKTLMFYFPPDPVNPYVRKSTQKIYTVKHPSQFGTQVLSGLRTTVVPPDKRFACIPASE